MRHILSIVILVCCLLFGMTTVSISAPPEEYIGQLSPDLIPHAEDLTAVILRPLKDPSKIKFATPLSSGDKFTAGRLYDPTTDKSAMLIILVEPDSGTPYLYLDYDQNNEMSDKERINFAQSLDRDGQHKIVVNLPMTGSFFKSYPIQIEHWKDVTYDNMKEGERLILQSTEAYARGMVDIKGKKTLVQYAFNAKSKKINPASGWLGIDGDGDGKIDLDPISPEAAQAFDEDVVFRVGDTYVSTKKVDAEKNQILMREHPSSDYKRVELRMGSEVPDFNFTDFNGKKRKLSEFRGKYLMIDFWGTWCGPCRRELPYLREAYSKFQARGFEILGMDDDEDTSKVKSFLKANDLNWTQATTDSIKDVMRRYRIHSFPTSLLLDPDGKIISLNKRGQPTLRGRELISALDELLPP